MKQLVIKGFIIFRPKFFLTKKIFLISLIFLNCGAMKRFELQIREVIKSREDSEETSINKIQELLEKGLELNCNVRAGFTALHYAVAEKKYEVCKFLIQYGANPHIENCDDDTPLDLASGYGKYNHIKDEKLIEILKSSKSKIFRPGMNHNSIYALENYNKRHKLQLEIDAPFK